MSESVFRLAAANYSAWLDVVDKVAATRGVDRPTLRDALGDVVDGDEASEAADEHDVPTTVVEEAVASCTRAFQKQYPELAEGTDTPDERDGHGGEAEVAGS